MMGTYPYLWESQGSLEEVARITVEKVAFETPVAPRIRLALKRYEAETGEDLSWSELGRRVWALLARGDVDTSKISRIKLGQQDPSIAEGGAFAYVLDVDPIWMFYEIGEMGRFPRPEAEGATVEPLKKTKYPEKPLWAKHHVEREDL